MLNILFSLSANSGDTKIINETILGLPWFDDDLYKLLIRFAINILFLTVIIRCLYYPKSQRKDYLFTYFLIGTITFFLCFALAKLKIGTGMGLGLFAIFGIIRYRTDAIEIKEMTYLFLVIGLSVINSLASKKISIIEIEPSGSRPNYYLPNIKSL